MIITLSAGAERIAGGRAHDVTALPAGPSVTSTSTPGKGGMRNVEGGHAEREGVDEPSACVVLATVDHAGALRVRVWCMEARVVLSGDGRSSMTPTAQRGERTRFM